MSVLKCDSCDRPIDTDQVEMESFPVNDDDHYTVCPACAESIHAEADANVAAYKAAFQERIDMIDAGREHLLPEYAERMNEMADIECKRRREESFT